MPVSLAHPPTDGSRLGQCCALAPRAHLAEPCPTTRNGHAHVRIARRRVVCAFVSDQFSSMAEAEGEEGAAPAMAAPPEPEKPKASAELLEACMLGRAAKLKTYFAKHPDEAEIINELKSAKNNWSPLQVSLPLQNEKKS